MDNTTTFCTAKMRADIQNASKESILHFSHTTYFSMPKWQFLETYSYQKAKDDFFKLNKLESITN